jgi:hypothetical protein
VVPRRVVVLEAAVSLELDPVCEAGAVVSVNSEPDEEDPAVVSVPFVVSEEETVEVVFPAVPLPDETGPPMLHPAKMVIAVVKKQISAICMLLLLMAILSFQFRTPVLCVEMSIPYILNAFQWRFLLFL